MMFLPPPVSYSPDNSTATGKPREYPFPSSGVDALDQVQQRVWDINYNSSKPKTTAQQKPQPAVKQSNRQLDVYRNPKVINEASVRWMRRNPGKMITSYGFTYYAVPGSGTIMAKANKVPAGYKGGWYNVFSNTKIDKARRKGTK